MNNQDKKENNLERIIPDVIGEDVQMISNSEGIKVRVRTKDVVLKRGSSVNELVIDNNFLNEVKILAAADLSLKDMVTILKQNYKSLDYKIFHTLTKSNKKIKEAIELGKAKLQYTVKSSVLKMLGGDEKNKIGPNPAFLMEWIRIHDERYNNQRNRVIGTHDRWSLLERMTTAEVADKLIQYKKTMSEIGSLNNPQEMNVKQSRAEKLLKTTGKVNDTNKPK